MKEPLSLRISDESDPKRGQEFQAVLNKRRASASDVIRGLIDAYVSDDGKVNFPVRLIDQSACKRLFDAASGSGLAGNEIMNGMFDAIEASISEYGGLVLPVEVVPKGAVTPQGRMNARSMIAHAKRLRKK